MNKRAKSNPSPLPYDHGSEAISEPSRLGRIRKTLGDATNNALTGVAGTEQAPQMPVTRFRDRRGGSEAVSEPRA